MKIRASNKPGNQLSGKESNTNTEYHYSVLTIRIVE